MITILRLECPDGHAVAVLPYDSKEHTKKEAEIELQKQMSAGRHEPWCKICGSSQVTLHHRRTVHLNFEDAAQPIAESIAELLCAKLAAGVRTPKN